MTLIPTQSNLLSPLQFRRSQHFYLSSVAQVICNSSLDLLRQWTIYQCLGFICLTPTQLDPTIPTTDADLYVPARALPLGLYQFTLTLRMPLPPHLQSTTSLYIRINPSDITPNLVQLGTSMITSGVEQDLELNPGSFSIDPDSSAFNATVCHLHFHI